MSLVESIPNVLQYNKRDTNGNLPSRSVWKHTEWVRPIQYFIRGWETLREPSERKRIDVHTQSYVSQFYSLSNLRTKLKFKFSMIQWGGERCRDVFFWVCEWFIKYLSVKRKVNQSKENYRYCNQFRRSSVWSLIMLLKELFVFCYKR